MAAKKNRKARGRQKAQSASRQDPKPKNPLLKKQPATPVTHTQTIRALMLANLAAGAYALNYYWPHASTQNPLLLVFTLTLPFYAALMAGIYWLSLKGRAPAWLEFIAIAGAFKYGLLNLWVAGYYPEYFMSPAIFPIYAPILAGNALLMLEALHLMGSRFVSRKALFGAWVWFLAGDYAAYWLSGSAASYLPAGATQLSMVAGAAMFLSFIAPFMFYAAGKFQTNVFRGIGFLSGLRSKISSE